MMHAARPPPASVGCWPSRLAAAPAARPLGGADRRRGGRRHLDRRLRRHGLDARWQVVNPDPASLSVSDGALRIAGQPGDTYQTTTPPRTSSCSTSRPVTSPPPPTCPPRSRRSTRAPASSPGRTWTTTSGPASPSSARCRPSGIAIETDVETGATFSAVSFADRPGSTRRRRLRLQRTGDTIDHAATGHGHLGLGARPATTTVSFDTTQVGLYALAAQDGTVLPAAFDSFTIEHAAGADVVPGGPVRRSRPTGDAPYLVADGRRPGADRRPADRQPAAARATRPRRRRGRALAPTSAPLVLADGDLVARRAGRPADAAADHRRRRREGRAARRRRPRRRTSSPARTGALVDRRRGRRRPVPALRGRRRRSPRSTSTATAPAPRSATRCSASSTRTSTTPPTAACTPSWCATGPSSSTPPTTAPSPA